MKLKNYILAAAMALTTLAAAPAMAKDWTSVVIGTEGAYAPWNLTNADGTLWGLRDRLAERRVQAGCPHLHVPDA
jgi:octopine/nopaline transport system substrate-binding protein